MAEEPPDEDLDLEILPGSSSYFDEKPPNPGYRVSAVPTRLVDQVQLTAVLRAFYGYGRLKNKADFADATAWIRHYWRRRAKELDALGWEPMSGPGSKAKVGNAMVCPPAFVMIYGGKKDHTHCGMPTLCPFCWARDVRQYWLQLETAFFPPKDKGKKPERTRIVDTGPSTPKSPSFTLSVKDAETGGRSPYDLVYRRFAFLLPAEYNVRLYGSTVRVNGLRAWLDSRVRGQPWPMLHRLPECRALLKAAGAGGGILESIQCIRTGGPGSAQHPWEVTVHQLIRTNDGDMIPKQLHEAAEDASKRHIVIRKPYRRALAQRVSEAFVYPRFLIDPTTPVAHVLEYLKIRRSLRLVASYGRFRARNPR